MLYVDTQDVIRFYLSQRFRITELTTLEFSVAYFVSKALNYYIHHLDIFSGRIIRTPIISAAHLLEQEGFWIYVFLGIKLCGDMPMASFVQS